MKERKRVDKKHNSKHEIKPKSKNLRLRNRPGLEPGKGQDLIDPNRKGMVKSAAAGRATRRLPLGKPPLVITTHAITSFRSSLPEPTGDQPRAGSGSSPSRHGSTTRKSVRRCVSCLDRQRYFIQRHGRVQQSKSKKWIARDPP
jgi:hypothetical protein